MQAPPTTSTHGVGVDHRVQLTHAPPDGTQDRVRSPRTSSVLDRIPFDAAIPSEQECGTGGYSGSGHDQPERPTWLRHITKEDAPGRRGDGAADQP